MAMRQRNLPHGVKNKQINNQINKTKTKFSGAKYSEALNNSAIFRIYIAPLKLQPYGDIHICLLLFFRPSVDMFPSEFKN